MNNALRSAVSRFAYPVLISWPLLVGMVALTWFPASADPIMRKVLEVGIFLVCAVPVVCALLVLEKKMPFWADRGPTPEEKRNDLTHLGMCWFLVVPIAQALTGVIVTMLLAEVIAQLGPSLWPTQWPLLFQVGLAIVVAEFFQYWGHRFGHETEIGWRLHSVHHGPHHLYWLNSTRFHALDQIVKITVQTLPLILLGCTPQVFLVFGAFTSIHGWVQHSNVAYRTRGFDLVLGTSANHRWHHSVKMSEANHNYGLIVMFWDRLFGTFHSPSEYFRGKVGIGDMPNFPGTYLSQLMVPFRWKSLERTGGTLVSQDAALDDDDEMERETA